ncbi:unnamed protein product [Rotaria sp. Silwood1]|nr:unnamed protein product [Rotaria sp. Silwood1]
MFENRTMTVKVPAECQLAPVPVQFESIALGLDLNCAQPSISPIPLYQEILPPADIEQARSDITRINDVMKTISSIL